MLNLFKRKQNYRYFHVSVDMRYDNCSGTGSYVFTTQGRFFNKKEFLEKICKQENVPKGSVVILSILEFKNKKDFENFNSNP